MNNFPRTIILALALILATSTKPAFSATQDESPVIDKNIWVEDQYGHRLNFFRDLIKNKTVAINFIFTRCTSSCPVSSAVFRKVQQKIKNRPMQLISISVDPTEDTPKQLRIYSESFKANINWHFITGEQASINKLLKDFGVFTIDKNFHTNMVLIGNDTTEQWLRLYSLPSADDIVAALNHVQ